MTDFVKNTRRKISIEDERTKCTWQDSAIIIGVGTATVVIVGVAFYNVGRLLKAVLACL